VQAPLPVQRSPEDSELTATTLRLPSSRSGDDHRAATGGRAWWTRGMILDGDLIALTADGVGLVLDATGGRLPAVGWERIQARSGFDGLETPGHHPLSITQPLQ